MVRHTVKGRSGMLAVTRCVYVMMENLAFTVAMIGLFITIVTQYEVIILSKIGLK